MPTMKSRFLQLGWLALAAVLVVSAAPAKKSTPSRVDPVREPPTSASSSLYFKGAPDSDVRNTPSASPHLETVTAPAMDRQAPSTELDPQPQSQAATAASPTTYEVGWQSVNLGAVNSASANYAASATAGQTVVGASQGATTQALAGYWYGASASNCSCPCQYDPRCDGTISDVLDVSDAINRAFRGASPTLDPQCPYERSDVDGSGATDVLDVTKVINVAFRGMTAGSQYDLNLCLPGDQ